MADQSNKMKIYKGVLCLEIASRVGAKWWYQTPGLAFTPFALSDVPNITQGRIVGTQRHIAALNLMVSGQKRLVAINLPRSDIGGMMRRGLWDDDFPHPGFNIENITYTPWPEYTENKTSAISLPNLGLLG